jgi:NAD(P)-dependent dehydrogenase (short-subunit alcohol dehydrogenase family)
LRYLLIETNWGNNRYQQHDAVFILISNKIDNKLIFSYVVPVMKQQRTGSIINIASMAAITGRDRGVYTDGMPAQAIDYPSAKAAIVGLTRDLAAYLGPDGIRVNAISPGGFERDQRKSFVKSYSDKTPLRGWAATGQI